MEAPREAPREARPAPGAQHPPSEVRRCSELCASRRRGVDREIYRLQQDTRATAAYASKCWLS